MEKEEGKVLFRETVWSIIVKIKEETFTQMITFTIPLLHPLSMPSGYYLFIYEVLAVVLLGSRGFVSKGERTNKA